MDAAIALTRLPRHRFPDAQAFYAAVGYAKAITADCAVYAAERNGAIIGVVRLAPEHGVTVLRGMMIAQPYQRSRIGTHLLQFIAPALAASDVYCLPHNWLEGFYGQAGFATIDLSQAPKHLQTRLISQRPKHPDLIVMLRKAGG